MADVPPSEFSQKQWRDALGSCLKPDFVAQRFEVAPAMVSKTLVNGYRVWTKFDAQKFQAGEYEIVEGMWDHEHCAVCGQRITANDEYWQNSQNFILCPRCHDEFSKRFRS